MARSTTEAEALALNDAAEMGIYMNKLMMEILGSRPKKIQIRTDNMSLQKALKSSVGVKSRRLRIDIAAIREMISLGIIQVEWVGTKGQVADIFTKTDVSRKAIKEYMYGKEKTEEGGED